LLFHTPNSPITGFSRYNSIVIIAAAILGTYLTACLVKVQLPIFSKIRRIQPGGIGGIRLLGIGISDWLLSSLTFFVLAPGIGGLADIPRFIHSYLIAHALGVVSQLPGGLGVFESTSLLMNRSIPAATMLASLICFRLVFFVLPLIAALLLLGFTEGRRLLWAYRNKSEKKAAKTLNLSLRAEHFPSVSVVIPAFNEEQFLPACLDALRKQDYRGTWEVIVVDNASTDATAAVAASFGCRVIEEPRKGYHHAIRRGFESAGGAIIASTDADTIVDPDWLTGIAGTLAPDDIVACGGVFRFYDGPLRVRLIGMLGRLNYHIAGANMAVKRDAYHACGGFSPHVNLGADVDIGQRLKKIGRVVINRSLVAATSSRRFTSAFWKTVFMYYFNDLNLLLFKRPVFFSFPDFRTLTPRRIPGSWMLPTAMTCFFLFLAGWFLELPFNQMMGTVLARGPKIKAVALTFDDGPGESTAKVLDILREHDAKATFFVIGKNAAKNPALLQRIVNEGHEIGNHSYSHRIQLAIDAPRIFRKEIDTTEAIIRNATGITATLYRPPHGWRNPWMLRECRLLGFRTILWSIDSQDWRHLSKARVTGNVLRKVRPGSIILMHDRLNTGVDKGMSNTIAALPGLLDSLSNAGFTFVTISELSVLHPSGLNGPTVQNGSGSTLPALTARLEVLRK
jgi:peptidoglycan-N-acetylglucosamine deacetylase